MKKRVVGLVAAAVAALTGLGGSSLVNVNLNVNVAKGQEERKQEVVYETRRVACTEYVTRYTACGQPYRVATTVYRIVQVPVPRAQPGCP